MAGVIIVTFSASRQRSGVSNIVRGPSFPIRVKPGQVQDMMRKNRFTSMFTNYETQGENVN